MIKLPPAMRALTRTLTGSGAAPAITPRELYALAEREDVLVIAVGMVRPGEPDPALPGEQRGATLATLAEVVATEPRERAIVMHCG